MSAERINDDGTITANDKNIFRTTRSSFCLFVLCPANQRMQTRNKKDARRSKKNIIFKDTVYKLSFALFSLFSLKVLSSVVP